MHVLCTKLRSEWSRNAEPEFNTRTIDVRSNVLNNSIVIALLVSSVMPQFPLQICDEKLNQLSADSKCPVSLRDRSSEINGGKRCG